MITITVASPEIETVTTMMVTSKSPNMRVSSNKYGTKVYNNLVLILYLRLTTVVWSATAEKLAMIIVSMAALHLKISLHLSHNDP